MVMARRSSPGRSVDQTPSGLASNVPGCMGVGVGWLVSTGIPADVEVVWRVVKGIAADVLLTVYTMLPMVPIKTSKRNVWSANKIGLYMHTIVAGED